MWNIKNKQTNKINEQTKTNTKVTENKAAVTRGEGTREGRVKCVKGINCMVTDGNKFLVVSML